MPKIPQYTLKDSIDDDDIFIIDNGSHQTNGILGRVLLDLLPKEAEVVTVEDKDAFDPYKPALPDLPGYAYRSGDIVSYINPLSYTPQFQTNALYIAKNNVPIVGIEEPHALTPEESLVWEWQGTEVLIPVGNGAAVFFNDPIYLRQITGYKAGDTAGIIGGRIYKYVVATGIGFDPTSCLVPLDDPTHLNGWWDSRYYTNSLSGVSSKLNASRLVDALLVGDYDSVNYELDFGESVLILDEVLVTITINAVSYTTTSPSIIHRSLSDTITILPLSGSGGSSSETVFSSDIVVSLSGGKTLGKYSNGQTIPAAGKTSEQVMKLIAIEELYPTLTPPSNSFAMSVSGLKEIGEIIPSITTTSSFNRGSISPAYGTNGFRAGLPSSYNLIGIGIAGVVPSSASSVTATISGYTVIAGAQIWGSTVTHLAGEQPKTSEGNNYDAPYSSGTTGQQSASINGVYPWFGSSVYLTPLTKQPLALMNSTYVQIDMVAENGVDKQSAQFPQGWSTITGIQFFNTNNNAWEWLNGAKVNSLSSFTQTASTQIVQGNTVNYTTFTHNGSTIGSRQLRFYTN